MFYFIVKGSLTFKIQVVEIIISEGKRFLSNVWFLCLLLTYYTTFDLTSNANLERKILASTKLNFNKGKLILNRKSFPNR